MEKEQEMIHKLNDLVQVCIDSQKGYRQAALEVHNQTYKDMFLATSTERGKFAYQLQDAVRELGAKPVTGSSVRGSLHRSWMNFRYGMNLHDDGVVFRECLRGEEKGLQVYQDIFWDKQFHELESMLHQQYVRMIEMRDQLEEVVKPAEQEQHPGEVLHL